MGLGVCLNLFRTPAIDSCGGIRSTKPARNPPKTHLDIYVSAFWEFVEIAGTPYLNESDLAIRHVDAKD